MVTFYSMVYGREIQVVKEQPSRDYSLICHESDYEIYTDGYGNYKAYRSRDDAS